MKNLLTLSVCLICSFGLAQNGKPIVSKDGYTYLFTLPAGWATAEVPGFSALFYTAPPKKLKDPFNTNINFFSYADPLAPQAFYDINIKTIKKTWPDLKMVKTMQLSTPYKPTYVVVYTRKHESGQPMKVLQALFKPSKGVSSVFTYTSSPNDYATFEATALQVLKSIRIKK